ncbi:alpha/beta hydrolase [Pseudoduganella eburnea]|uniref:Alpha/beta hydrolase n=1 Tax=Massilia eburnea TaxID=1776165 RepID=A0A6L6QFH1_9BURK|nr:alpha/beta hydrolase [Massilia eburnea]MTW10969.1 alpha/beta hydrolase [Massilia eburnea]
MAIQHLNQFRVLVAPGLHNSGPEHWQSRWQRLYPRFERVEQKRWSDPVLLRWADRLDEVLDQDRRPTLIVAHSFGCLTTALSLSRSSSPHVAGVLLVGPADPDKFQVSSLLPRGELPCPSIMVASTNDPWMTMEKAETWARRWGSDFVNAGALGHINADSGLGDWRFGQRLLQVLAQRASNLTTEKKNEFTPWRYRTGLRTGVQHWQPQIS